MVWNEHLKREIPEGWKLASIINNPMSKPIKPGVTCFDEKTYLATADVVGTTIGNGTRIKYETRESRANMEPRVKSVWFAKMKSSVKHIFFTDSMHELAEESILSTGFLGLQCNERSFEYIMSFIRGRYFEIAKDQLAHGATQQAVNNDDLKGIRLLVPSQVVLNQFHTVTRDIYEHMGANIVENKKLVSLRDWLLPMLMNGQATISSESTKLSFVCLMAAGRGRENRCHQIILRIH